MADGEKEWLMQTVTELTERVNFLETRLNEAEIELDATVKRRDSIEIGTAGKGGQLKIYFNALGDRVTNDGALIESQRLLILAGGTIPNGGER